MHHLATFAFSHLWLHFLSLLISSLWQSSVQTDTSVVDLQFGMSKTVTRVIRSERETLEAWVLVLLVHHYNWKSLSPEDFSVQLNERLLYTYYTSLIHLL